MKATRLVRRATLAGALSLAVVVGVAVSTPVSYAWCFPQTQNPCRSEEPPSGGSIGVRLLTDALQVVLASLA